MSPFHLSDEAPNVDRPQRVGLDERFLARFLPETPLDRVESQELRQHFMEALKQLTPTELKVVELRFQHKKSTGQVASKLQLDRAVIAELEQTAIEKLRVPIVAYLES